MGLKGPASHDGSHGFFLPASFAFPLQKRRRKTVFRLRREAVATDSLKIPVSTESMLAPVNAELPGVVEGPASRIPGRVKRALEVLVESLQYSQDIDCSLWDFAVEMSTMRRLKVSNSDLRWMIAKGWIDHAIEVTMGGDSQRCFSRPMRAVFCRKTNFVLTSEGAAFMRAICGGSFVAQAGTETSSSSAAMIASGLSHAAVAAPWLTIAIEPELLVPKWDRYRQELNIGSIIVKRFKVPAANQEAILAAFEEEAWPTRIDDPLPPHREQSPKRRLQETIKSLNRNQKRPLLKFLGDGSGQGVRWEYRGPQRAAGEPQA
jgi:hypothetical protein